MIKIGLTGSIGMGKSTISKMFEKHGIPIWDADKEVHRLYQVEAVQKDVVKAFGEVLVDGQIDKTLLLEAMRGLPDGFKTITNIFGVYLLESRKAFVNRYAHERVVLFDVPLLIETGMHKEMDKVVVVTCPFEVQKERVLRREGMTEGKFLEIMANQMPDLEKQAYADYIINTNNSLEICERDVGNIVFYAG